MEGRDGDGAFTDAGDTAIAMNKAVDAIMHNAAFLAAVGKYADKAPDLMQMLSSVIDKNNTAISVLSTRLQEVESELRFRREIDGIGEKDG